MSLDVDPVVAEESESTCGTGFLTYPSCHLIVCLLSRTSDVLVSTYNSRLELVSSSLVGVELVVDLDGPRSALDRALGLISAKEEESLTWQDSSLPQFDEENGRSQLQQVR